MLFEFLLPLLDFRVNFVNDIFLGLLLVVQKVLLLVEEIGIFFLPTNFHYVVADVHLRIDNQLKVMLHYQIN